MHIILIFLVLFAGGAFFSLLFNRKIEEALPVYLLSTIFIMYLFGIFSLLSVGFYLSLSLPIAGFIWIVISAVKSKDKLKKLFLTPGCLVFFSFCAFVLVTSTVAIAMAKFSFDIYLYTTVDVSGSEFNLAKISLTGLLDVARNNGVPQWQSETFINFFKALFSRPILGLPFAQLFLIICCIFTAMYLFVKKDQKKQPLALLGTFVISSVIYCFVLLISYVFLFDVYGPTSLPSYERYMASYFLAFLIIIVTIVFAYLLKLHESHTHSRLSVWLLILAFITFGIVGAPQYKNILAASSEEIVEMRGEAKKMSTY